MQGEIFFNLSALVAFCVISAFFMDRWPLGRSAGLWMQGGLFGVIAVVGMRYPVELESGVIFDGRSVVLCLAAWHFGWRATLVSAGIAATYRLHLGGAGVPAGVGTVVISACVGLLFRQWVNPEREEVSVAHTVLLSYAVHLPLLPLLAVLLSEGDKAFFLREMAIAFLTAYPLATLLAGRILADQQAKTRALARVERSDAFIRHLLKDGRMMTLLLDPGTGRVVDANDVAISFYGFLRPELMGRRFSDLQVPDTPSRSRDSADTQSGMDLFAYERHRTADGGMRSVDVFREEIEYRGREVVLLLVVDVTERIEAVRDLRRTLWERERILETAMNGFWISNDHGVIEEVNPAYCAMTGFSREDVVGRPVGDFDLSGKVEANRRKIREKGKYRFESVHPSKHGEPRTFEVSVSGAREGENFRYYAFFRDITEEKKTAQRLRLLDRALSTAANTVMITDAETRIEWVNAAFCEESGYGPEETMGKKPGELVKSGKHPPEVYEKLNQTIHAGEAFKGELINRRKNGELHTVDATITPIKDENGVITHFIGINQDITEKKNLENLYLRSQRLDSVGTLTSGIAHDLNNILSPIVMSADLLRHKLPEGESREMAEIIGKSADRGAEMLHQLLAYARGSDAERRPLHPGPLVRETIKFYRETFPPNVEIREEIDPDLPPIEVDTGQLSQVMGNLLVNARDAMPEGGTITVSVREREVEKDWARYHPLATPGRFVRIRVKDTGHGIPVEERDRIFDPFYSTKPEGRGTGLGLSTSLSILKGHHGFITVHSDAGAGTRMDVFFPVSESPEAETPPKRKDYVPDPERGAGYRILVVDDEEAVRKITANTLEAQGYVVEECVGGREALDRLRKAPPVDLMLLDYMMRDLDGGRVLRLMEEEELDVPVLMITGMMEEELDPATRLRGRPVLYKPFTVSDLLEEVERIRMEVSA